MLFDNIFINIPNRCIKEINRFAYMTMSMHGLTVRSIVIKRAAFIIFAGDARSFGASNPVIYMEYEAGMRFTAHSSFFCL